MAKNETQLLSHPLCASGTAQMLPIQNLYFVNQLLRSQLQSLKTLTNYIFALWTNHNIRVIHMLDT